MTEGIIWAIAACLVIEGIFGPIRAIVLAFRSFALSLICVCLAPITASMRESMISWFLVHTAIGRRLCRVVYHKLLLLYGADNIWSSWVRTMTENNAMSIREATERLATMGIRRPLDLEPINDNSDALEAQSGIKEGKPPLSNAELWSKIHGKD